jgi:tetratricopeptide (TPR) repeat protein
MDDAASKLEAVRAALLDGRTAEALELALRELALRPDDATLHELVADCYDALGDEVLSDVHAARAWELSPSDERTAQSLVSQAASSMHEHDIYAVRRLCKRAVVLDPRNANAFALLAEVQNIFEKWDDARKAANTALHLHPGHTLALTQRAVALRMLGEAGFEQDTIDAAIVEDENDARVQYWAGETALYKGEHELALQHFVRAQELDNGFEVARIAQCEALKSANPLYRMTVRAALKYRREGRRGRLTVASGLLLLVAAFWMVPSQWQEAAFYAMAVAAVVAILGLVRTNIGDFFLQFSRAGRLAMPRRRRARVHLCPIARWTGQ